MTLNLIKQKGVPNIPNVLKGNVIFQPQGYGSSPESSQEEIIAYKKHAAAVEYTTIYTVTTGKTLYITNIIHTNDTVGIESSLLATGGAGAEIDFMELMLADNQTVHYVFNVPIKFGSGTRISFYGTSNDTSISLVGWEE